MSLDIVTPHTLVAGPAKANVLSDGAARRRRGARSAHTHHTRVEEALLVFTAKAWVAKVGAVELLKRGVLHVDLALL